MTIIKLKQIKKELEKFSKENTDRLHINLSESKLQLIIKSDHIISNVVIRKLVALQNLKDDFSFYYSPTSEGIVLYLK